MADIKHLVGIEQSSEKVFALVSTGSGFTHWWAEDVFEDTGDSVSLGFFGRTTVYRLRRVEVVPNSRVVWKCESGAEWEGTRLVFELASSGKQRSIRFSQEGWREETEYFRSCNTTWGELMFRLKAAAEGKSRGPLFCAKDLAY